MTDVPVQLESLADLRRHVLEVLCERENLIVEQFTLQESALVRRGQSCGRQFTLYGPRSIRLGAVWAADRNDLYFYDACGERFRKERLAGEAALLHEAA
jgi:hypothetical protein